MRIYTTPVSYTHLDVYKRQVVGIFIIAAVLTPPDVVSQLMLAIPMCLLYEAGIIAAKFVTPRKQADGASA